MSASVRNASEGEINITKRGNPVVDLYHGLLQPGLSRDEICIRGSLFNNFLLGATE